MSENEDFKIYEHLWQVSKYHTTDVFSPHSVCQSKGNSVQWLMMKLH